MARAKRNILPGHPYHVTRRGLYGQAIFHEDSDRAAWLGWLGPALDGHDADLHAYVLMDNHIHLLLTPRSEAGLSFIMKQVGQRLAQRINRRLGRTGGLWEGRFHAALVADEAHFMRAMRYIEQNPQRAGMVAEASDWRWSSHAANTRGARDPLLRPHPVYESLGPDAVSRQTAYAALFAEPLPDADIQALRRASRTGAPLGTSLQLRKLESLYGVRLAPRQPGPHPKRAHPKARSGSDPDLFD